MFLHVSSCFFMFLHSAVPSHLLPQDMKGTLRTFQRSVPCHSAMGRHGKTGKGLCRILINSPISQCGRCCTSRLRWSRTTLMAASSSVAQKREKIAPLRNRQSWVAQDLQPTSWSDHLGYLRIGQAEEEKSFVSLISLLPMRIFLRIYTLHPWFDPYEKRIVR